MTTRGLRINNPGNIRKNANNQWKGQRWPGLDTEFCQFDAMENGIRAMGIILLHGQLLAEPPRLSLRDHAYHYAPPNENNTEAYIRTLADRTGFDPDYPLDLTNRDDLVAVLHAFIDAEQGASAGAVKESQVEAGAGLALRYVGAVE